MWPLAKRAGLLHDLGKAVDHEIEGSHVQIGVDLARRYKENELVVHAIAAHHGDIEPQTIVACLVQAADAISAARPGARRENVENYIKRLEKLEEIASSFKGVDNAYAIQAGREIRIMIKPEEVSEDEMIIMAHDIARKIEKELEYPGQIKVHLVRESHCGGVCKVIQSEKCPDDISHQGICFALWAYHACSWLSAASTSASETASVSSVSAASAASATASSAVAIAISAAATA